MKQNNFNQEVMVCLNYKQRYAEATSVISD